MLHKPRGYITTMSDERDRKCVAELIKDFPTRLYPVGRLDRESEGLLLMTNDGAFANEIIHPSHHVAKTYRVTVHPRISEEQLTALTKVFWLMADFPHQLELRFLLKRENAQFLRLFLKKAETVKSEKCVKQSGLRLQD